LGAGCTTRIFRKKVAVSTLFLWQTEGSHGGQDMKWMVYDEDGPLRAFRTRRAALRFAHDGMSIKRITKPTYDFEEALF
jgi:hypothetical protein